MKQTYADLVADVTRAANVFAALGVAADRPVAYVLPNFPETHFAIWGGEAAGATLAVNPMLEPRQIADIMRFARASILVTLAPALNPKAWSGLAEELAMPRRREAAGTAVCRDRQNRRETAGALRSRKRGYGAAASASSPAGGATDLAGMTPDRSITLPTRRRRRCGDWPNAWRWSPAERSQTTWRSQSRSREACQC